MNHGGFDTLGFSGFRPTRADHAPRTQYVLVQHPLKRTLSSTRRSIDDVVNSPLAKNEVYGYYKLSKQIDRFGEIRDLERQ